MARLNRENVVLAVIDVQGKLSDLMVQKDRIYDGLIKMIRGARALELPILWLEQLPDKLGPTRPEIAAELQGITPIVKNTFSACDNEEFMAALRAVGRPNVLVAGIESHICLYQTSVDLLDLGWKVHALMDCMSSRTEENRLLGLEKIKDAGGRKTSVETVLFELQRIAAGPAFKALAGIVK